MLPNNDLKAEAYKLVILSDLTDTKIESDNPYINMLLTMVRPAQIGMKQRYEKSQKDGATGGRPPTVDRDKVIELRNNGYTQCQISNALNCHVNTVKHILKEYNEGTLSTLSTERYSNLKDKEEEKNKEEEEDKQKDNIKGEKYILDNIPNNEDEELLMPF